MTTQPESFFVIGVATRTDNGAESDPVTARVSALWQRALRDPYLAERRAADGTRFVAVLTDYECDHRGAYTQIVGVPVNAVTTLPELLVAVAVPAAPRLHIPVRGTMPHALIAAWTMIWRRTEDGDIDRAYRTGYELHTAHGADIYLSTR
jgi:predicted transcriptional regulator YdeE